MKCHYIYDKEAGKVMIPGCWGTAIYGDWACTCRDNILPSENTVKNKEIRELEKENDRLNRIIKNLLKKSNERAKTTR